MEPDHINVREGEDEEAKSEAKEESRKPLLRYHSRSCTDRIVLYFYSSFSFFFGFFIFHFSFFLSD